jgi:hypothetical protein
MAVLRNAQLRWRPATATDLPGIQKLSDEMHSSLPERPEVFAEKLALFQRGCFVLTWYEAMVGYSFSYPWVLKSIPPLDRLLGALPHSPECLFIHYVVIQNHARGYGAARVLVDLLVELARRDGLSYLVLVSVYGTYPLWARFGFEIVSDPALSGSLNSYGDASHYMMRAANQ